jgi:hypothetical protein
LQQQKDQTETKAENHQTDFIGELERFFINERKQNHKKKRHGKKNQ